MLPFFGLRFHLRTIRPICSLITQAVPVGYRDPGTRYAVSFTVTFLINIETNLIGPLTCRLVRTNIDPDRSLIKYEPQKNTCCMVARGVCPGRMCSTLRQAPAGEASVVRSSNRFMHKPCPRSERSAIALPDGDRTFGLPLRYALPKSVASLLCL